MNTKYQRYIDFIVNDIKPPYFKNMVDMYGLRPDEYELVLSKLYNQPVTIKGDSIYDNQRNKIYGENSDGDWHKKEYDADGNETYTENSDGYWHKYEYDNQRNKIYGENSNGYWVKREYDTNGNITYFENSHGTWYKKEYDNQGNIIYKEDSDGNITDNR